jgi:purine catabolism regulator
MATTVSEIVGSPDLALRLLAGEANAAERSIRWVHVSELDDPTPWLQGGELLLTTGMGIGETAAAQRAYVRRLADANLAGLGVGLGFSHESVPRPLVTAAEREGFPLFEVPYPIPFIAITEAVFRRLVAGQYDLLQRAVTTEHVLTRAVMDGAGVAGVTSALAEVTGGWVLLMDLHGVAIASSDGGDQPDRVQRIRDHVRDSRPDGVSFSLTLTDGDDHVWVQPVVARGRIEAFLAVGTMRPAGQHERIVAGHALSLYAMELSKERAVAEAERRLQGDFFDDLVSGSMSPQAAGSGLERFGFDRPKQVMALSFEVAGVGQGDDDGEGPPATRDGGDLVLAVADERSRAGGGFLVRPTPVGADVIVPAEPMTDLAALVAHLDTRLGVAVRAGAGSPVEPSEAGRSLREASYALRVCRLEGWGHAGFADLGSYRLLLSMTDPDALRAFVDAALAPLDAYDREGGGHLVASLEAFLRQNARWEHAASELFVHRHTLRYRMRKVEELTGRDLSKGFDRMELWLALRARDLLAAAPESSS